MHIDDFEVGQQIGRGGFATVFKAQHRHHNEDLAIKIIEKNNVTSPEMVKRVHNEIRIHSMLSHSSIVHLHNYFEDEARFYLVMELCEHGNMYKRLKNFGPLSENKVAKYCKQILGALRYLQTCGVIHRDMKLSNLLIDHDFNIKLCDFGLATQLEHPDEEHFTICGTPNYIAPEIASQQSHGFPADLWALGCLCFSMLTGKPPFEQEGVKETLEKIVSGQYSIPLSVNMSAEAQDFIKCLLHVDPSSRASAEELQLHPFLSPPAKKPLPNIAAADRSSQKGTCQWSAEDLLQAPGGGALGVNASAATTALASCDTYTTSPGDDGAASLSPSHMQSRQFPESLRNRGPWSELSVASTLRGQEQRHLSPSTTGENRLSCPHPQERSIGEMSSRSPTSSWTGTLDNATRRSQPPLTLALRVRRDEGVHRLHQSYDGSVQSCRSGKAVANGVRHSFDQAILSSPSDLTANSRHSHSSPHTQLSSQIMPPNWRDSLQSLRRNLSLSCTGSAPSRSRLSVRHSEASSGDGTMSWSLESTSSYRRNASSVDNSYSSFASASLRHGDSSAANKTSHTDSAYRKLWVPRQSLSARRNRRCAQSEQSHRRAFSYSSPRGDVLIVSTLGDVAFCTYLKDKAGRMRPCRLVVRAHEPLKLRVGKVNRQMCREILTIRDENNAYQNGPSNGESLKSPSSSRGEDGEKAHVDSMSVFSDTLWIRSYHVTSLPSSLSSAYNKVSRMLAFARKKIPKLILYITRPPTSDHTPRSSAAAHGAVKGDVVCKCMLMSNSPLPDFYMRWADGMRLSYSLELSQLQISHVADSSKAYRWDGERTGESDWSDSAPKAVRKYLAEAQVAMRKCLSEEGKYMNSGSHSLEDNAMGSAPRIIVDCLDGADPKYQ